MSKPFIKTFPVLSCGFQIETELSIHAVDRRWRIADVPVEYRDRPEGSVSKLNTVKDGLKVIAMIGTLFKDYRPLKFFSLVALIFCIGGLCAGMPVVTEYLATGPYRGFRPPSSPRRSRSRPPSRSPRASSWTPWRKSNGSNGSSAYTARPRTNKAKACQFR